MGGEKPFLLEEEIWPGKFFICKLKITDLKKKIRLPDMKHITCQENSNRQCLFFFFLKLQHILLILKPFEGEFFGGGGTELSVYCSFSCI